VCVRMRIGAGPPSAEIDVKCLGRLTAWLRKASKS
jgi:hypothetical protein